MHCPPPLPTHSDELCTSIVRSHRETSQYRTEELQALRWKVFSREEIQAYQTKVPVFLRSALKLPPRACVTVTHLHTPSHRQFQKQNLNLLLSHNEDNRVSLFDLDIPFCLARWPLIFTSRLMQKTHWRVVTARRLQLATMTPNSPVLFSSLVLSMTLSQWMRCGSTAPSD